MTPEIKKAVQGVIRFFMNLGLNWKKALLVTAIVMSAIITFATTVTYFVTKLVVSAFVRLYAESSGHVVQSGLAHLIAVIMAMGIFFLLTVGIILMIDELRNWMLKILVMAAVVVTAGWLLKLFKPITDGHPRASVLLTVTVLLFALGAIAQVLGQGDALKNFSWLGKMAAVIFFCWLALMGACGGCNTEDSPATTETVAETTYLCTFHTNGKDYSARVLGPGRFEVMSPQKRASATFSLSTSDGGSWSQTYPKDSGAFKLEDPDYSTNTIKGASWTAGNPGQQDPMSLTCQSLSTLAPNS